MITINEIRSSTVATAAAPERLSFSMLLISFSVIVSIDVTPRFLVRRD